MTSESRLTSRILELDALRGLAIIAVMLYHYTSRYVRLYGFYNTPPFEFWYGRLGVEFFFILSGFVIFMTLSKTKTGTDFIVSRLSRLYPVFWASALFTLLIVSIFSLPGREVNGLKAVLANLTMVPNLFGYPLIDGAYWFLERLLFFYAIIYMLFILKLLKFIKIILLIWLATAIILPGIVTVCELHRISPVLNLPYKIFAYVFNFKYIAFFSIGILFYSKTQDMHFDYSDWLTLVLCIFCLKINYPFADFIIASVYILICYFFVAGKLKFLQIRPLVFMGTISYALFLVHQNLGYIILRKIEPLLPTAWLAVLIACCTSILVATLLTFVIEKPATRILRSVYIRYRQRTAV